ncbi:MAG: hypothetical protein VW443_05650 [Pseudomonadales bacterium]|jgi:hypothetical protein
MDQETPVMRNDSGQIGSTRSSEPPIATEVVFEDERVRVWRQFVPAGSKIERHHHQFDYCLVNIEGEGPLAVQFHEGSGGSLGERITFSPTPGTADFVAKGHIETAENHGEDYHAILIEFKKGRTVS